MKEAIGLYRSHAYGTTARARACVEDFLHVQSVLSERLHFSLQNLDILEIGPGQFVSQMTCFSRCNRVVGIDLDVIVQGFAPRAYWQMLQVNGWRRTLKTIGRKVFGFDRAFARELRCQLGIMRLPRLQVLRMDVSEMDFPDQSFDFAYSRAVFHHLPDPHKALCEIVRVLRPGGAVYIALHPYTSETGCLDPRVYTDRRKEVRGWPHLRKELQNQVDQLNAYLNKLRISQWQELFLSAMPEAEFIVTPGDPSCAVAAEALHSQGELLDYSVEELAAGEFVALWQKPRL